jgi:hypothetical protein
MVAWLNFHLGRWQGQWQAGALKVWGGRLALRSGSICFVVAAHYRKNDLYTAKLIYEVQYLGSTYSARTRWCGRFGPLLRPSSFRMTGRLQKCGWPNCNLYPLCKETTESVRYLFVDCRFTIHVWQSIKVWVAIADLNPTQWVGMQFAVRWNTKLEGFCIANFTPCVEALEWI